MSLHNTAPRETCKLIYSPSICGDKACNQFKGLSGDVTNEIIDFNVSSLKLDHSVTHECKADYAN